MAAVSYSADTDETTPAAENEQPRSSSRLILWLVVAGLGILLLPLLQISTTIKNDNAALEDQAAAIEATLTSTPPPGNQALRDQLVQLQAQTRALENVKPTLVAGYTDWLTLLQTIGGFDSTQIMLDSIAQNDPVLVVTGHSIDENTVTAYAQMLTDSNLFKRVIVQSIILRNSTPSGDGLADFTISLELASPQQAAH